MRLYDRRMAGGAGSSAATAWRAPLVAGYVPTHLKAALLRPRTFGYSRRAARLPPHARQWVCCKALHCVRLGFVLPT